MMSLMYEYYYLLLQECLRDFSLALQNGYAKSPHYKLHTRRGQCLASLKRHKEQLEALQSALKCLELMEDMSLSKKCKSCLKKHAQKENGWSSVCMIPRVSVMSAHYSQDSG
jgi:hypothetical protein